MGQWYKLAANRFNQIQPCLSFLFLFALFPLQIQLCKYHQIGVQLVFSMSWVLQFLDQGWLLTEEPEMLERKVYWQNPRGARRWKSPGFFRCFVDQGKFQHQIGTDFWPAIWKNRQEYEECQQECEVNSCGHDCQVLFWGNFVKNTGCERWSAAVLKLDCTWNFYLFDNTTACRVHWKSIYAHHWSLHLQEASKAFAECTAQCENLRCILRCIAKFQDFRNFWAACIFHWRRLCPSPTWQAIPLRLSSESFRRVPIWGTGCWQVKRTFTIFGSHQFSYIFLLYILKNL